MDDLGLSLRLPLFPLPNVVHFPCTELRLHVFEPRYRQLVRDLLEQEKDARWIGMVLLKPGWQQDYDGSPEVFPGGTAGRLVDVELLPDGHSNIVLHGDYRFEIRREVTQRVYREALVAPLMEPDLNEQDAGVRAMRRYLLELALSLVEELSQRFPFNSGELEELASRRSFEEFVNRLAADLDVPPLRKLELLTHPLPDRASNVLSILRSRRRVLDLLRPYRRLSGDPDLN